MLQSNKDFANNSIDLPVNLIKYYRCNKGNSDISSVPLNAKIATSANGYLLVCFRCSTEETWLNWCVSETPGVKWSGQEPGATSEINTHTVIDATVLLYSVCCALITKLACVSLSSREWDNVDRSVRGRLQNRSEDGEFWWVKICERGPTEPYKLYHLNKPLNLNGKLWHRTWFIQ